MDGSTALARSHLSHARQFLQEILGDHERDVMY
uniref:Uncharacterized protein n=1 Tax=Arundo donax TaxID=35708 RepID=A0A0A8XPL8_ARUDO